MNPKQTYASRYALWIVRKQFGGSPVARKVVSAIAFAIGFTLLIVSYKTDHEEPYYLGLFMILIGIQSYQFAGFTELLGAYDDNKKSNQRLEAIVKTPVESGNAQSTQPHP